MDVILNLCDERFFTPYVYPSTWPENDFSRQLISLFIILTIAGYILYFATASASFFFVYDHDLMKHPKFLKNQIRREIGHSCKSIPIMSAMSALTFIFEVRGHAKLYDRPEESMFGIWSIPLYFLTFLFFTDMNVYFAHRLLHHRLLYKRLHKSHHMLVVPTPFASHAFNPIDAFFQGVPYHVYVFLFPLHKLTYLACFMFINMWSVSIHDGVFRVPNFMKPFVLGSAHHNDHHTFYYCNHGQFFTLWDRIGGTYKYPSAFEGKGVFDDLKKAKGKGAKAAAEKGAEALGRVLRQRTVS